MSRPLPTDRTDLTKGRPAPIGYQPALDGLRGVAVLLVMSYHFSGGYTRGGFIGVDVFFVLSGFLITTLLLEERDRSGRVSLRRFYARRALRLLPALALVVAVAVGWALVRPRSSGAAETLRGVPFVVFYIGNWARAFIGDLGLLDVTWSLSMEEQFYLVWPAALVVLLGRGRPRAGLVVCVVLAALIALGRGLAWSPDASVKLTALLHDTRGDVLLVGCALAFVASSGSLREIRAAVVRPMIAVGAALVLLVAFLARGWQEPLLYRGGFTVVALAAAAIIVGVVHRPWPPLVRVLSARPLVATGTISYGLYLWHGVQK